MRVASTRSASPQTTCKLTPTRPTSCPTDPSPPHTPDPAGQSVRLVAVPSFSSSGALVLLNLRTNQCQLMHFGAYRGGGAAAGQ